jgi:hypothetical protein
VERELNPLPVDARLASIRGIEAIEGKLIGRMAWRGRASAHRREISPPSQIESMSRALRSIVGQDGC